MRYRDKGNHWKGGRCVNSQGYILIYKPDHPFSNTRGYVREHRLVMEENIGRYLEPNEAVHHINGNKSDNRIENLQLMTHSQHNSYESQKKWTPELRQQASIAHKKLWTSERRKMQSIMATNQWVKQREV